MSTQPSCFPEALGLNFKSSEIHLQFSEENRLSVPCLKLHKHNFYFGSFFCCVNIYTLIIFSFYLFSPGLAVRSFLCQTQKTLYRTHFNKDKNPVGSIQALEFSRLNLCWKSLPWGSWDLSGSSGEASIFSSKKVSFSYKDDEVSLHLHSHSAVGYTWLPPLMLLWTVRQLCQESETNWAHTWGGWKHAGKKAQM